MQKLTVPETVAEYNYKFLSMLLYRGLVGAVTRGQNINMAHVLTKNWTVPYKLQIGDTVHRFLRNGDYVAFGRQPTLRQESILGMRIERTVTAPYRLPLTPCTPLNADRKN